jgi:hypothetical protein
MIRALLAAVVVSLCCSQAFAMSDVEFSQSMSPAFRAMSDGRYKIAERKANQALDLLKDLKEFADQTKDRSDRLRKEMLDNHYEDWVNTELSASIFETKSLFETIKKTQELEHNNVKAGLSQAKAGDYGPVEAAIARIAAFEADYEGRVKAVDARVAAVRAKYEHHFGNAKTALAQFEKLPLLQELLSAKPQLVKKIELVPASVRPIRWSIRVEKKQKDGNDPRFGQIPRVMTIQDGADSVSYAVSVR